MLKGDCCIPGDDPLSGDDRLSGGGSNGGDALMVTALFEFTAMMQLTMPLCCPCHNEESRIWSVVLSKVQYIINFEFAHAEQRQPLDLIVRMSVVRVAATIIMNDDT